VQERYTLDPYGLVSILKPNWTARSSSNVGWNTFFQGKRLDATVGLYYFNWRFYSPTLFVFVSQDPIGFAGGGSNLYGLEGNSPVNRVDPWGLEEISLASFNTVRKLQMEFLLDDMETAYEKYKNGKLSERAYYDLLDIFAETGTIINQPVSDLTTGASPYATLIENLYQIRDQRDAFQAILNGRFAGRKEYEEHEMKRLQDKLEQQWQNANVQEMGAGKATVAILRAALGLIGRVTIRGTRGIVHCFDSHAAQWFGREVSAATHMERWTQLVEKVAESKLVFQWSLRGTGPTVAHVAKVEGKWFVVQFFKSGPRAGEIATAFVPTLKQLKSILRILRS